MTWLHLAARTYWLVFGAAFLGVAVWESRSPARPLSMREERRWGRHAAMMALGFALTLALFRISPVVMALAVADSRLGVLNTPWLPVAARWALAILALDLVRYGLHVAHHAVPLLWRVHQVHHSDPDLDASTGVRFHPIEVIVTQGAYLAAIALVAPPVGAVVVTELLFAFQSVFSHANASLSPRVERPASLVWVTPAIHRVHHSDQAREHGSNYGDLFPWWDRLFHTYLPAPADGVANLRPGLDGFQNDRSLDLAFMLALPFRKRPAPLPGS
jgi:sterol desaturase/sphingolipid hydroxylase (fatty acid hydroxylase superfamily)